MPVSIIIGGQYGSEGKGKASLFFAEEMDVDIVVRVGGINSGHTVIDKNGIPIIFRVLPTPSILKNITCILPSGSYFDLENLNTEIKISGIQKNKLLIDPFANIITKDQKKREKKNGLGVEIGSTQCGIRCTILDKISEKNKIRFAKDEPELKDFICETTEYFRKSLYKGKKILIEGTQGHGLSILHSKLYPYSTSRDTSASAFLSETGLSPFDVENIIMVIRSLPIRVSGNSGPLFKEIDWDTVTNESGSKVKIEEYTSVSKKVRRVARFFDNIDVIKQAIQINQPNIILLNHIDHIDASVFNKIENLTPKCFDFIKKIDQYLNQKINYIGTGPKTIIKRSVE